MSEKIPLEESSCFFVRLLIHFVRDTSMISPQPQSHTPKPVHILIVDDSRLIRSLLRVVLEQDYHVSEAKNGREGLQMALDSKPDLIITDLMMPELNGYQMVSAIRENADIAHLPTIMLTTIDTEFNELEGYRLGVDAYLLKPFTKEQLVVRVDNLLRNRALAYGLNFSQSEAGLGTYEVERSFDEKLEYFLKRELANANLKVKHLADYLSMSVSTFERRIKEHYETTPKIFIREFRLHHAISLLKARSSNVSGVARACGFDNISYFSLCFREKFGISPSEVLQAETASA